MDLPELTDRVRAAVGAESGLDATIKFNFGDDGLIFIDGKSEPNCVSNENAESMITINVTKGNFERILDHDLSPQKALMTGKMRLKGEMRLALRLNKVFGTG